MNFEKIINNEWYKVLEAQFRAPYFSSLTEFVKHERETKEVYPPKGLVFNAFNKTPLSKVKVVLLGQDPYHGVGQAHGLSFSVPDGIKIPPSLRNMYKELNSDINFNIPSHGNLEKWANQGVLLLNATLTVRAENAGSHQKKGWETFTDAVIKCVSDNTEGVVFLLWGNYAQKKECLIDQTKHNILKAVHPSPLSASRGFFGCKHFSQTNKYLSEKGKDPIDWCL